MNKAEILKSVEDQHLKTDFPPISVGDTVTVYYLIVEAGKQRPQPFKGDIIRIQGTGLTRTFTVRRIVANEGVERTFPVHSPRVASVKIERHGHTRRSKLYYLRDRVGKARRLADRRRGLKHNVVVVGKSKKALAKQRQQQSEQAAQAGS